MEATITLTKYTKFFNSYRKCRVKLYYSDWYQIEESWLSDNSCECTKIITSTGVVRVAESFDFVDKMFEKWRKDCINEEVKKENLPAIFTN